MRRRAYLRVEITDSFWMPRPYHLATSTDKVAYLDSLLFAADDLVRCLSQGPSRAAVIQVGDRLGIPANGSWTGPGSAPTAAPGKERGNDQTPRHQPHPR